VAEAGLRACAEFADRLRGRRLTMLVVAAAADDLPPRLTAIQTELGTPPELAAHALAGDGAQRLPAALTAAGAAGAPLLAYVDIMGAGSADQPPAPPTVELPLRAIAAGRPAELLLVAAAGAWPAYRAAVRAAGFPLAVGVELVDGDSSRLLAFATRTGKSLEAFKEALWAVDEYAGVQYRDPGDPTGHLLDISLEPHPGPLRRQLLARLAEVGGCSVTELRQFTLTDTVYRSADASRVLHALLAAGALRRSPERGRLAGDVLVSLGPSPAP
jgi:hypothetical protein